MCGASDQSPLPGCSGKLTFLAARDFCQAAGARLCSLAELVADEARSTGCGQALRLSYTCAHMPLIFFLPPQVLRLVKEAALLWVKQ